jgi:SagB-type dehydrogenase family enzyme
MPKNAFQHPVRSSIAAHLKAHEMAELSPKSIHLEHDKETAPPSVWTADTGKIYTRLPKIELRKPVRGDTGQLEKALKNRHSVRTFSCERKVTLELLTQVLATGFMGESPHRPFPSAGARYPTEAYIIINDVQGLAPGLFHLNPKRSELALLLNESLEEPMKRIIGDEAISTPSFYIVLTSVLHRSMTKYSGRAYRFALIEIGAAAQTIQLACQVEGLSTVWIGGFADGILRDLLDLNWELELETPMLLIAVGYE